MQAGLTLIYVICRSIVGPVIVVLTVLYVTSVGQNRSDTVGQQKLARSSNTYCHLDWNAKL